MVIETKDELRKIFREKRKELSEKEKHLKSRDIVKNFYANISIKPRSVIAGYIATPNEVDISILLDMYAEDGHTICLPCIDKKDSPMKFRKYAKGVKLKKNADFAFMEPPAHFQELLPDVVITPILAFDAAGTRLGQGAGYYDRTMEYLEKTEVKDFITVGVAFACQQTQFIRRDHNDYKLDALVTEKTAIVF